MTTITVTPASRCRLKDEKTVVYLVENGYSTLHPYHRGNSFFHRGNIFKSMVGALVYEEAFMKEDKSALSLALRWSGTPSKLRNVVIISNSKDGEAKWIANLDQTTTVIIKDYLRHNPDAVAELLATTENVIAVKGKDKLLNACTSATTLRGLTSVSDIAGENLVGKALMAERPGWESRDQMSEPSQHFKVIVPSSSIEDNEDGGLSHRVAMRIDFLESLCGRDIMLLKSTVIAAVDHAIACLPSQSKPVSSTFVCDGRVFFLAEQVPTSIGRGEIARGVLLLNTVDQLVVSGLNVSFDTRIVESSVLAKEKEMAEAAETAKKRTNESSTGRKAKKGKQD